MLEGESVETKIARIDERTSSIQADLHSLRSSLASTYVTRAEFAPVRSIIYSLVGAVGLAVIGAILALVFKR